MPSPNKEQIIDLQPLQNLAKISSWSHTWSQWIVYFTAIPRFTTKEDKCLKQLQDSFPKESKVESKPYNKNFFVKLHKLVLAHNTYADAARQQERADGHLDSIKQDYAHSTLFGMFIPLIKLQAAKFNSWRKDRAANKAKKNVYIAGKNCTLEKLKQNPSLKKKVEESAKNELQVLESVFESRALNSFKTALAEQENKIPTDFWTDEILKEYIAFKVGEITEVTNNLNTVISDSIPEDKARTIVKEKTDEYKKDPKNQLRLAVRVADNITKTLNKEIKKCNQEILHLEAQKAENATVGVKFTESPRAFVTAWMSRAYYFVRLGFKAPATDIKTDKQTAQEIITECNQQIKKTTQEINDHKEQSKEISHTRPMFPSFSSADKQSTFMEAVNAGKQYVNSIAKLSKENFGLTTELEQDTFKNYFTTPTYSLNTIGRTKDKDYLTGSQNTGNTDKQDEVPNSETSQSRNKTKKAKADQTREKQENSTIPKSVLNSVNPTSTPPQLQNHSKRKKEGPQEGTSSSTSRIKFKLAPKILNSEKTSTNPESTQHQEMTIHKAAAAGNLEQITHLYRKNSSIINEQDEKGMTPIMHAAANGKFDACTTLINRGAYTDDNYNIRDENNMNILMYAARDGDTQLFKKLIGKYERSLDTFESAKKIVDLKNKRGQTLMALADNDKKIGDNKEIKELIRNQLTAEFKGLLDNYTKQNTKEDTVSKYLSLGVDVNVQNRDGETALHLAIKEGQQDLVQALLNAGADANISNNEDFDALGLAIALENAEPNKDYESIIKLIAEATLIDAASADPENLPEVERCLAHCKNIEIKDEYGLTALLAASWVGNLGTVKLLLKKGADITAKDNEDHTALHLAAESGHLNVVEFLLEKGADITAANLEQKTALDLAKEAESIEEQGLYTDVINLLTKKVEEINTTANSNSAEPKTMDIYEAAAKGGEKQMALLVKNQNNHTPNEKTGMTPIMYAASNGNDYAFKILSPHLKEESYNTKDKEGMTVLMHAAKGNKPRIFDYFLKNHIKLNKEIVDIGEELIGLAGNNQKIKGSIMNQLTTEFNDLIFGPELDTKTMTKYLKLGVDVNTPLEKDDKQGTALHVFAKRNHNDNEAFTLLMKNRADINAKNSNNSTALHTAAEYYNYEAITFLLENGADINAKNNYKKTALDLIKVALEGKEGKEGKTDAYNSIINLLKEHTNNTQTSTLSAAPSDQTSAESQEMTILEAAAKGDKDRVTQLLLENKKIISTTDDNGCTALHLAAEKNHIDVIKLLMENGANIQKADDYSSTALHFAASSQGNIETVKLLIQKGANIHAKDIQGYTALHFAAENNHIDVVNLLLENTADITAKNNQYNTALMLAKQARRIATDKQEYTPIIDLLEKAAAAELTSGSATTAAELKPGTPPTTSAANSAASETGHNGTTSSPAPGKNNLG